MITIRSAGVGNVGTLCYPCGDNYGRSPGIQGLRGIKRGALGVLSLLNAAPTISASGRMNTRSRAPR
jgi:hypothetical protein